MKGIQYVVILLAVVLTAGCEMMQTRAASGGVTLVTMSVIENAQDPADKAERIRRAVDDVEAYLEDGALTISALEWYARSKIDRDHLTPREAFLWEEAIGAVIEDLLARGPTDGLLDADGRAAVKATLAAIRRAIALEGY